MTQDEPATVTRLALVDDHPTLLDGLAGIFASDPSFSLVATGGSAGEAVAIVRQHRPDLIIVDLSMPGDVFAAIAEMAQLDPHLKLVVFTAFSNVELALRTMDAGAHAFVMKGGAADDLFNAIDAVRRGEIYVSPGFSPSVLTGLKNRARQQGELAITLTTRERQVKSNRDGAPVVVTFLRPGRGLLGMKKTHPAFPKNGNVENGAPSLSSWPG